MLKIDESRLHYISSGSSNQVVSDLKKKKKMCVPFFYEFRKLFRVKIIKNIYNWEERAFMKRIKKKKNSNS